MNILNIIFPGRCLLCGEVFIYKDQNLFCDFCLSSIKKEKVIYCKSCGRKVENCQNCLKERKFDEIKVFKNKDKSITEMIYQLKIGGYKTISKVIANIIKEDILDFTLNNKIDIVTFVPLDKSTEKERGFNHLYEILINIFPKYMIIPLTEKTRKTKLQMELSAEERRKNLKGVFRLKNYPIREKRILIFDDILTTGSTMLELYKTIKKGKPSKIYGYVIAR